MNALDCNSRVHENQIKAWAWNIYLHHNNTYSRHHPKSRTEL